MENGLENRATAGRVGEVTERADVKNALLWKRSDLSRRLAQIDATISRVRHEYLLRVEQLQAQKKPLEDALYHVEALLQLEGQHASGGPSLDVSTGSVLPAASVTDAVFGLLEEAGRPMHYKDIAVRLQQRNTYVPGKDPAATLLSRMTRDSRFKRTRKRGTYALSTWRVHSARFSSHLVDEHPGDVEHSRNARPFAGAIALPQPGEPELGTVWDLVLSNRVVNQASLFALGMCYGAN